MEDFHLTETEQRYFGDLFVCCDADKSGKIPLYKASELFRSANLPTEILKQITELCGGNRATHLGRRQFYSALKLIAAFQAGLSLGPELFMSTVEIPLPRFSFATSLDQRNAVSPDLIQLSDTDGTPTPHCETAVQDGRSEVIQSPLQDKGRLMSPMMESKVRSPEVSSTASDSPTPTNSIQEKNWVATTHWQGIVCEEQRQLLGTEEESSDKHSSDDDNDDADDEVWTITEEQREYYSAQFRLLQPDPQGLLAGPIARMFFEKSRLPVQELRKIWQLSDISKDGALSLEEFNTAMHLVVLRRNNISLPDSLPPSLVPVNNQPATLPPQSVHQPPIEVNREENSPSLSPSTGEPNSPPRSKEWTKFVDSPTSSVSSPGPKPVNFDFHKSAVEQDPKILHPKPLRVTPESQVIPIAPEEDQRKFQESQPIQYEQFSNEGGSPKKGMADNNTTSDIRPIQRPQAKKPTAPGPGAIPPPPQPTGLPSSEEIATISGLNSLPASTPMGPKKEPPPPPPPRPYRTHTRSSSLDLNRLGKSGCVLGAPPVIPPRVSPNTTPPKKLIGQRSEGDVLSIFGDQMTFADFGQFCPDEDENSDASGPRKHGAFEVYRKPVAKEASCDISLDLKELATPLCDVISNLSPAEVLQQLKESNTVLVRLCRQLGQELSELREQRASLEHRLEQLQRKARPE